MMEVVTVSSAKKLEAHTDQLGLPFPVTLLHGVTVDEDPSYGLLYAYPDSEQLWATVALLRVHDPRRLVGSEIQYLLSVLDLNAETTATMLDVPITRLQRWMQSERPDMDAAAERLLRIVSGQSLRSRAPGIDVDARALAHQEFLPNPDPAAASMVLCRVLYKAAHDAPLRWIWHPAPDDPSSALETPQAA